MKFLPSCSCVHTTIWMHHKNTNKMHGEKANWELPKNAAYPQSCKATCFPSL